MPAPLEDEGARLAERYAELSDIELEELGQDSHSLTPVALEMLTTELTRRKLASPAPVRPPNDEVAPPRLELVTLRSFRDLPPALIAKAVLDNAGIPAYLADENTVRIDWLLSNAIGGIKLTVRREDAAKAEEALTKDLPELTEDEDISDSPEAP